MKRIHSAKDPLMIGHLKNVLATFGIRCVTRNLDLNIAAGELPPIECWPELWVVDDEKVARAKSILKKTLAPLGSVKKAVALCRLRRDDRGTIFRVLEVRARPLR